jgi:hypothetical protein
VEVDGLDDGLKIQMSWHNPPAADAGTPVGMSVHAVSFEQLILRERPLIDTM